MRKITFTVATLAMMMASCSNNEVYDVVNTKGNSPIAFTNLNDRVSRAANDSQSDYKVYAKSNLAGESDWFINDVIQNVDNKPESGNVYYWPSASGSSATVDFYAWAPSSVNAATSTRPNLSIDYTVPANADEDFTVAIPKTGMSAGTVDFKFTHMLSKISVSTALTQALTDADYGIEFTSATLVVNKNGGTVDPAVAPLAWSTTNSTTATYNAAKTYMVMPQTSTDCTVQLKGVTIKKGEATVFSGDMKLYTIAADNVTGNEFAKGKHYNLKLTVSNDSSDGNGNLIFGNEITFSASIEADWGTPVDVPVTQP